MANGISFDERILLTVLAIGDAIGLPTRSPNQRRRAVGYERQRDFRLHGVTWNSRRAGAVSQAGRKNGRKAVTFLSQKGLLEINRPRTRLMSVRLTNLHVVTAWLGNSEPVARKHYLQVTDEHFRTATHIQTHSGAEIDESDGKPVTRPLREDEDSPAFPVDSVLGRDMHKQTVAEAGLEPARSFRNPGF